MHRRLLEALAESAIFNLFAQVLAAVVIVAILAIVLFVPEARAQIPAEARGYQRAYTRIVRSEWGLDAPVASLAGQIHQESGWNCRAVSRVGARGCAQFMPTTADWIGRVDRRLAEGDVMSPAWAFRAQAVYMRWLLARVRADNGCERMAFGMSAYNGGLDYVQRRQKLSQRPGVCLGATCDINPGITAANQRENAHYPRRILRELEPRYRLAGWGIGSCAT